MNEKSRLQWWVPVSCQIEQAKRDLPTVFPTAGIARIVLAVVGIFIAAVYLLPLMVPELEFDWIAACLKCFGFLVVMLGVCCALACVPPMITVSTKGVMITQGPHSRFHPYAELAGIHIEDTGARFPMLVLTLRSRREPKRYPIAPGIQLDDLRALIDNHRTD